VVILALVWKSSAKFHLNPHTVQELKDCRDRHDFFKFWIHYFQCRETTGTHPAVCYHLAPPPPPSFYETSVSFTAVKIHITVSWAVTPSSFVERCRCFGGVYSLHLICMWMWKLYISLKRWHTIYNATRCHDRGNQMAHYLVHKSLRFYLILCQFNALRPSHHVSLRFAPILHSHLHPSPYPSLSLMFSDIKCVRFPHIHSCALHISPIWPLLI
jgi:hypothetical protein